MPEPSAVGGLKWVQGEIVASLRRVRTWLEAYVDQTGSDVRLDEALTALREVRGVLSALQLAGPARLTEEMQQLCEELAGGRVSDPAEASEALMLALIQLPDYLDRVQDGHPDTPLALLSSINDLRATRGVPPLPEAEMLVPASVLAETGMPLPDAQRAMSRVANKVRPHFHRSLLMSFREGTERQGLVSLGRLCHQLRRYVREGIFHEVFLAAEAVVEAMIEGSLPTDSRTRALIGHLDRLIKPFTERPDAWPESDAQALLVDLLSLIARCDSSSYLVTELRSAYGLKGTLDEVERGGPGGPGPAALGALAAEAQRELVPIKDLLDLCARGAQDDLGQLAQLAEQLGGLAKTLAITGDQALVERLHHCRRLCAELVDGGGGADDLRLLEIAEELLAVEEAIAELAAGGAGGRPAAAVRGLTEAALREARADLIRGEQAIAELTAEQTTPRGMRDVPELFHRVAGALRVLAENDAADVLDTAVEQVRQRFVAAGRPPQGLELDLLAEAISAIDLYIEGLRAGQAYRPDLVQRARKAVDELAALPRGPAAARTERAPEAVSASAPPSAESPAEPTADEVAEVGDGGAIDPEFLEIFLEEAKEEEENVRTQFARWHREQTDDAALTSLRRSFHTLKGSGRLVGALRMGDFAQAVEMLLNRVIDGTVEPTPELLELVGEAVALLPALIEAEAGATPFDVSGLVARAQRLAQRATAEPGPGTGGEPRLGAKVIPWPIHPAEEASGRAVPGPLAAGEPTVEVQTPEDAVAAEMAALADADEELLDIFRTEALEHLEVLRSFLAEVAAPPYPIPSDPVVRALHTLTGSARMTGVASAAAATGALERLLGAYQMVGADVDRPALDLLSGVIEAVALRLEHLPGAGSEVESLHALAAAAGEQLAGFSAQAVEEIVAAPVSEAPGPDRTAGSRSEVLEEAVDEAAEPLAIDFDWEALVAAPAGPGELAAAGPRDEEGPESAASPPAGDGIRPEEAAGATAGEEAGIGLEPESQWAGEFAVARPPEVEGESSGIELAFPPVAGEPAVPGEVLSREEGAPEQVEARELASEAEPGSESEPEPEPELEQGPGLVEASTAEAAAPAPEVETLPPAAPVPGAAGTEADLTEPPADGELLVLFLDDARDILDKLDQSLRDLQLAPTAGEPIEALQRLLHTLKGSARLAGLSPIGDLSHALESLLTAIARGEAQVDDETLELAQRSLDALSEQVDAAEARAPLRRFAGLVEGLSQALEEGLAAAPAPAPDLAVMAPTAGAAPEAEEPGPAPRAAPAEAAPVPHIRVRADLLNRLVNNAGEISIYRSRLAQQSNLQGFRLGELGQTVERLREQLRQLEIETEAQILYRYERDTGPDSPDRADFDPLELDRFSTLQQLSRSLAETVNDLVSLRVLLSDLQSESEALLQQQERIADDLQDGLLRTRMVPFAQVVPRLHRLVRQTAQQLGRKAQLQVFGPEVEIDRGIQERIAAPLEHLLRNAVAHGIETPAERSAAGKPATGTIRLRLSREGNDVVIAVSDDGAGLNLEAIRRRALERGLIAQDARPSDADLAQLILESGFSTADKVTQIAGRGVGLDVVNAEIRQLSGSFNLEFRPGQGTSFTIRLPLTLAIIEALLVEVAGEVMAIPHATIEAVSRIAREDLEACHRGEERTLSYAGEEYRVLYLGGMLQLPEAPDFGERRWLPVLLARSGDQRLALHVDLLRGSQRIVVKPLGLSLGSIRWLSGGTILPDGRVALIVDLLALIRSGALHEYMPPVRPEEAERRTCIMVVDDSLTVRRVTSRILRRQEMDVITAQDGIEALTLLEERIPDVILLDIEMPRMDGYELTRHIRRSPRLKDIPLIMITSRTGEKHRRHALELGVNRYLGKPYQEAELLDEISSVLIEAPL